MKEEITLKQVITWKLIFLATIGTLFLIPPNHYETVFFGSCYLMFAAILLFKLKLITIKKLKSTLFLLMQVLTGSWIFMMAHNL